MKYKLNKFEEKMKTFLFFIFHLKMKQLMKWKKNIKIEFMIKTEEKLQYILSKK